MYFTYVVRPGEAPAGRSPNFRPFWDACMSWNLRLGLGVQLLAILVLLCTSFIGGTKGIGLIHLSTSDSRFISSWCAVTAIIAGLLWTASACLIQGFRNTGDDEGSIKFSRGYRSGTKALNQATLLDIIASAMIVLFFFAQLSFFEDQWQTEAIQPNPVVIFNYTSRIIHSVALLLYGAGFMLMETYHTTGTAELWGWILITLYKTAAISEFLAVVLNSRLFDSIYTVTFVLALVCAFFWSQVFEPLILSSEVQMDQSALRNEFFKSRNSMAYYGPQVDGGQEMVNQGGVARI